MIGYQCAPAAQAHQVGSPMRAPSANQVSSESHSSKQSKYQPLVGTASANPTTTATISQTNQLKNSEQEQQVSSMKRSEPNNAVVSLNSHLKLISQSSSPPSNSSSSSNNQASQQQQQSSNAPTNSSHQIGSSSVSPQLMQASSPGYHSAASSPSSSIASPVSSSSAGSSSAGTPSASLSLCSSAGLSSSITPSSSRSPISPNLLDYYPELNQDGLGLSWFHEANNRTKLSAALMTNKMLVAGDISLAEMSRYPVPIMAKPPLGVSDITLENWLQEMVHSQAQKGIKLTFTSTRTVEPAFRVLARHAEHIKGPLILSADILSRPSGAGSGRANRQQSGGNQTGVSSNQQQPVDAWTFLMLCRTRFPKSIISIGWCSQVQQTSSAGGSGGCSSSWSHQSDAMSICSMADSSSSLHSSADSMFELDILDSQPSSLQLHQHQHQHQQQVVGSHLGHLQHLNHQHRLHQHLHLQPYPLVQASQQRHLINQQQLSQHLSQHQHQHHHHQQHNQHLNHHILSSTGSLNSSSGNSSGSPSPTSPISHLMSPPHQTVAANLSLSAAGNAKSNQAADSTEQLFLAARKCSSASPSPAAAIAAAVMAASNFQHQQLPLNLNINEADQQLSSSASSISNLAKKIQSYQTINQHNLTQNPNSALASKLFNQSQHVHKKTALSLSSSSNSPQLASPKQQQQQQVASSSNNNINSQLLLKTTQNSGHQQQQCNNNANSGYTRDMIDKMASLVKEYNLTQPVTFPVEARLSKNSLPELQRLLYQVGSNSTLTVVAQPDDLISVDDLLTIRKAFATNQVLFDLPEDLAASLKQELDLL